MMLLDTNVVSEPLRPAPDAHMIESIDAKQLKTLFLSAITGAELRAGVALLPPTAWSLPYDTSAPSRRLAAL